MPGPGNILIKVGADAGQAVRELSTVDKALGGTMSSSEKMSAGLSRAALPAAAALAGIGIAAVAAGKAAAEDAAEQEHLAGVLERVTGASKAQVAATEDWISGVSRATGVADSELRPALEKIVTATGDITKSQELMQAALDISAASGKDLDTVSVAIAKGYTGQTAALSKLVPGLSEASKKSKDFGVIMGELANKTGGAAAQAAGTATGQFRIFTNQMGELQEALGAGLLPVINALLPILLRLADLAAANTTAIEILVAIVASLAAGILVANAALKLYEAGAIAVKVATAVWTAAQWLLNAALEANPIGLVILALTGLAAALVIAYQRSETFRNIVHAAMDAVRAAVAAVDKAFDALLSSATAAFNWVTNHWKVALFALGPIGAAVALIADNFDTVKSAADRASDLVDKVWRVSQFAFGPVTSAVQGIAGAFSSITGAVNGAIAAVQSLIGWLDNIHIPDIHLPHIPGFNVAPPAPASSRGPTPSSTAATAGGTTINVYGSLDPEGTARSILRLLRAHERRIGLAQ